MQNGNAEKEDLMGRYGERRGEGETREEIRKRTKLSDAFYTEVPAKDGKKDRVGGYSGLSANSTKQDSEALVKIVAETPVIRKG